MTILTFTPDPGRTPHSREETLRAIENLHGISQRMGSTTTVENFLEMRREDLRLEEEKLGRFLKKGE